MRNTYLALVGPAMGTAEGGLDRAAHLRGDAEALRRLAGRPGARMLGLAGGDPVVAGEPPRLRWDAEVPEGALFLGLLGGEGVWARASDAASALATDLRAVMTTLPPGEAQVAATARALLHWHARHGFCAACGAATRMTEAGWRRDCPACGAAHFPRTDPVVIMLVTRGDEALLGRSPGWPAGMHSCLAGFMEPGETVEAAVRREVAEEAGVAVGAVRYLLSQPWPFPASLMLGCHAEALSSDIVIDPLELEGALWVSRERLGRVMAGRDAGMAAPRPGAIASVLLAAWLADRLDWLDG